MGKCYNCSTLEEHLFSQCLMADCSCPCVNQIYKMRANQREDEIKPVHPSFLSISTVEVKKLPNQDKDIKEFCKVKRSEWIKTRKDRRFKKK
jgi:hypothetical protein